MARKLDATHFSPFEVGSRDFGTLLSGVETMARKPVYGLHKATNQARTKFNGKRIFLGRYDSPKSRRKFDEVLAKWEAAKAGRTTPTVSKLSLGRLAILFLEHAATEYSKNGKTTGEYDNFRQALRSLMRLYAGCRVIGLGPKKLKVLQKTLVDEGLAQATINSRLRRIKQVFDWAVSEKLIPVDIVQAVRSVKGFRGPTAAAVEVRQTGRLGDSGTAAGRLQ